jgi:hypothetical protein
MLTLSTLNMIPPFLLSLPYPYFFFFHIFIKKIFKIYHLISKKNTQILLYIQIRKILKKNQPFIQKILQTKKLSPIILNNKIHLIFLKLL